MSAGKVYWLTGLSGAGALVIKNIEANKMVMGMLARVVCDVE